MEEFLDSIKNKITNEIEIEKINVIDETFKHLKHKSFDPQKKHIKLEIYSKQLSNLNNRLSAHKKIMSILKEDLNKTIHSLQILIK
jgi:BolA protein